MGADTVVRVLTLRYTHTRPILFAPLGKERRMRANLGTGLDPPARDDHAPATMLEPRSVEAASAIGHILDMPPVVVDAVFSGETRLTKRWTHGELHDTLPAFNTHVIITHYGTDAHEAVWRTEGRRLASRMRAGTITLIPSGHDGRWDISGGVEVSHVYLPDARLQAAAKSLTGGKNVELLGRAAFEDPAAAGVMELLSREASFADPSSRLFVEQALDLLCTQLIRGHSSYRALTLDEPRRGLADWQVRKVTSYMREHLEEEVGLDELAALLSLSRFHFGTAFRLATGRTPHEWLVGERIGRARALLADPRLPVTEIALSIGYQTPSSFAAAFRKVVGATPSEFRRQLWSIGHAEQLI